jgi:enoyl-CoA hydratase/carnithine racemase
MGDTVLYEAADAVATLTLNRPERRDAIAPHQAAAAKPLVSEGPATA